MLNRSLLRLLTLHICILYSSLAFADQAILIVDGSGSMREKIKGRPKIEIMRQAVGHILDGWPSETQLGVLAYGHRKKGSCRDIELIVPTKEVDISTIRSAISKIEPKGKTPITGALKKAADSLKSTEQKATIILVSDGLETCDEDPCKAAAALKKAGVDLTVHVVGFGTKKRENRKLRCVADNTGGRFFGAANAEALGEALKTVQKEVSKPETIAKTVFKDTFDGDALGVQWKVHNEDIDAYVVDEGGLLMVNSENYWVDHKKAGNLVQLQKPKLEGDWDISVTIKPEFKTGADQFDIVIMDGKKFIVSGGIGRKDANRSCKFLQLQTRTKKTETDAKIIGTKKCGAGELTAQEFLAAVEALQEKGGTLTLHKRGRNYHTSFSSPVISNISTTDPLKVLRPRGAPGLYVSKKKRKKGEVSVIVDEFELKSIEVVE